MEFVIRQVCVEKHIKIVMREKIKQRRERRRRGEREKRAKNRNTTLPKLTKH